MKIKFEKDNESLTFAVSQNVIHDGYFYDEIIWAEITELGPRSFEVRWESDYSNPKLFGSMAEAEDHVKKKWNKYKPTQNGDRKFIE